MDRQITLNNWLASWPDALGFVAGLGVARWAGWNAGDLIWSLWLSSLVVGYATIVWMIGQPAVAICYAAWSEQKKVNGSRLALLPIFGLVAFGALFLLAFFTVHFGGFHYVQSQILLSFFPINTPGAHVTWAVKSTYIEIFRRYWVFLPSAFLAHRAAFLRKPLSLENNASSLLAARNKGRDLFAEPYKNVLRMHVLMFFFFFAYFLKLENFVVYTVIYATYFFPWRLVKRPAATTPTIAITAD